MLLRLPLALALVRLVCGDLVDAYGKTVAQVAPAQDADNWVTTWVAMPQLCESNNLPPAPHNGGNTQFKDATLRQTIQFSIGTDKFRVSFSNTFGGAALPITAASVAFPVGNVAGGSTIQTSTIKNLTFNGSPSVTIATGQIATSDPVSMTVAPMAILTINMYLQTGQASNSITSHPGSRTTSWFVNGNQINSADITGTGKASAAHWYFISAVDAVAPADNSAFVIIGDSITDGRGSDDNKNNRWPNLLLNIMQKNPDTAKIAVLNQAAGGNRILADGLGPAAVGRVGRDVLSHKGVKYAMIFEGVNDIGTAAANTGTQSQTGDQLIAAYVKMVAQMKAQKIKVIGGTITPFMSPGGQQSYSDPTREVARQRINKWIKENGTFDAYVDFAAAVADPKNPQQMNPTYNTAGDYLHPNVAGYQAMAEAFPLTFFK